MTQEAIKMELDEEDLALIEKAFRDNPHDMKARVAYLETGIREVRARLASMKDCGELKLCSKDYSEGVLDGAAFAVRLLEEILPESDEEMGLPILTRDEEETR